MPPVTCRLLWSGARWVAPLLLLATPCAADVVLPGYTTGLGNSAVYVLFSDGSDTAVQMTEGASLKAGTYTASDSAIATASLGAGTYSATIRLGDYSSPSASDTVVGVVDRFVWDGTNEVDQLDNLASAPGSILHTTTVGTVASQTQFTIAAGASDDNAYQACLAIVVDQSNANQKSIVWVTRYTGSSRTIRLHRGATFTVESGDTIYILPWIHENWRLGFPRFQ